MKNKILKNAKETEIIFFDEPAKLKRLERVREGGVVKPVR